MKKRNTTKNIEGFTLVEVIVVAVIVAVLAAVAIPMYLGYVNDTKQNMANSEAAGFSSAVSAAINYGFNGTTTNWASSMNGPVVLTWPHGGFTVGNIQNDITYRIGNGVSVAITGGDQKTSPGNATITIGSKTATANW